MRLLTQIYAPLSDDKLRPLSAPFPRNAYRDEFDRLLYTYGCVKKGCLGVRLLRAARRSDSYAKAGREKRTLLAAERAKKEQTKAEERAINPFASGSAKVRTACLVSTNDDLPVGPDQPIRIQQQFRRISRLWQHDLWR